MDLEMFIWIAVILVYVLGVALKRLSAAARSSRAPDGGVFSDWKAKIEAFFTHLQEEIQQSSGTADKKADDVWKQLQNAGDTPDGTPRTPTQKPPSRIDPALREAAADLAAAKKPSKQPPPGTKPLPAETAPKPVPDVATASLQPMHRIRLQTGPADLRRAVVMSEILAPPVALRF